MDNTTGVIIVMAAIGIGLGVTLWHVSRGREILNLWAQTNGYRIISSEIRWFNRGPFFWTTSKGQMVYYLVIQTPDGQTKRGYVRCGSFFWGIMKEQVEERWEGA